MLERTVSLGKRRSEGMMPFGRVTRFDTSATAVAMAIPVDSNVAVGIANAFAFALTVDRDHATVSSLWRRQITPTCL